LSTDDDYKREVLDPAKAAGDQPPEDLRVRYRLGEPLRPAEVAASVKQVRQCWRRARGQLKYRKLIDRLEAEHPELVPVFSAAERGDLGPLTERLRGAQARSAKRLSEARARLLDAAGAVRMLAPADLTAIAKSGGVAPADLARLAQGEGIEVREPDPLPLAPPYAGYARAREALDVLGHRHLADFVHDRPEGGAGPPLRVLDGPGSRLDAAAIARTAAEWARRARDTSSTNAETVLIALKSTDPAELLRYDVVDRLRQWHRQRASEQALLHFATQGLGLHPGDARRLVFAVRREDGPAGGAAGRLRELLDAGNVHAAAELADALDSEAAEGDVAVLAAEARQRVGRARELRDQAQAEPDPDTAWRLLSDALHLVPDLPGAEEHRRRLPPAPVPSVHAEWAGDHVMLSWEPSPSTAGEIGYRVVRRAGGPREEIVTTGPDLTAVDPAPPVNIPLHYGVAAWRGEASADLTLTGPVTLRPDPADVEVIAGDRAVTGRWQLPPEATGARVTRTPLSAGPGSADDRRGGRHRAPERTAVVVEADRLGFTDRDVRNDVAYQYRIAAVYLDADGREHVTRGVVAAATPSAPPEPIAALTLEPDPIDPNRLTAVFDAPPHGTPELILLPGPPPWPYGAVVPVAEVHRTGRRLAAAPGAQGLTVRARGSGVVLAVTVTGPAAAIGPHTRYVSLPPPTGLTAQRRGDTVLIAFDWPPEIAEVQVTCWIGGHGGGSGAWTRGGRPHRVRLTRAGYEADGGLRIPVPDGEPVDVAVAARSGDVIGAPATITVGERQLIGYDVERTGPRWRRSLVVTLSADKPVKVAELKLVVRDGKIMPTRPDDGETLASWTDVDIVGSVRLTVPEPRRTGPYWLRCFAMDETLDLADPPVRRLQVT
jgi:hypothetical protein